MGQFTGIDWLNKLNKIATGSHAVTGDEATANEVDIDTGSLEATGFIVQVFRSDVEVTADADITLAAGVLTVADGAATLNLTEADVINWIVF